METQNVTAILNLIQLTAVIILFLYTKRCFSSFSSNVRNRLQTYEIILNVFMGFIVFFVISNKAVLVEHRVFFFFISYLMHIGSCLMILKSLKQKETIYPKSYLIFHNGKFMKGSIVKSNLSENDIMKSLELKGVFNLGDVHTIILEVDGELTVIYKEKFRSVA